MTCLPRDKNCTGLLSPQIYKYNHKGVGSRPGTSWNSLIILEFQSHIKGNFILPPLQFATLQSSQMVIKKHMMCFYKTLGK